MGVKFETKLKKGIPLEHLKFKAFKIVTKAGFLESKNVVYPNGESVATVAIKNEFGVPETQYWKGSRTGRDMSVKGIPSRPFMRTTWAESESYIKNSIKRALYKSLSLAFKIDSSFNSLQYFMESRMDLIGEKYVSRIRKTIRSMDDPPNSPQVIAEKRSSNPLIDTGVMIKAVSQETKIDR